jgi:hypothetical protein
MRHCSDNGAGGEVGTKMEGKGTSYHNHLF